MIKADQFSGTKWVNATLVTAALLIAYIFYSLLAQVGDWFDLEAHIRHFNGTAQASSVLVGIAAFILLIKSKQTVGYLEEVYRELTKVTWATRDDTTKLTIGIMVGVLMTSCVLAFVDLLIGKLFGMLY